MNQAFWTVERAAGGLLVAGFLIPLLAAIIMIASGAFPAFSAMLQGELEQMLPQAATFRLTTMMFAVSWVPQALGFGLLALLLKRAGDEYLAPLAFILILIASVLGVLHATFRMSMDPWAAQAAAQTGGVPEIYESLRDWIGSSFKIGYLAHFAAVAAFGWEILRTGFLAPWVGQVAIGWSLLWLLGGLVGAGAPALPLIMPAVIGAALLGMNPKIR